MTEYVNVGKLSDFPSGAIMARRVGEKSVAVVQVGGRVHAYLNICPHAGYTLSGGKATESLVICDVHDAHFDIDSGQAVAGPSVASLTLFEVRLEGDDVLVAKAQ